MVKIGRFFRISCKILLFSFYKYVLIPVTFSYLFHFGTVIDSRTKLDGVEYLITKFHKNMELWKKYLWTRNGKFTRRRLKIEDFQIISITVFCIKLYYTWIFSLVIYLGSNTKNKLMVMVRVLSPLFKLCMISKEFYGVNL